ncbi:MAG: IS630 family transposase, partial [Sulfurimonas sp.]|nr:IS630 family transposase [Sulfurimonas sp.]
MQTIFKKVLNLSYKRVRRDTARKPDSTLCKTKKKELEELESKALTAAIDVEYFDKSGFNLNPNLPYAWNKIGETLSIPSKRSGNLNVLGSLNKNKSILFASTTNQRVDTEVVIAYFHIFAEEITKPTVAVVDNASIHTSKKFKDTLPIW